jgi:hypothetical protein
MRRRLARVGVIGLATAALLALAQVAVATVVPIDGTVLTGGGSTSWDPLTDDGGLSSPTGYSPVDDGAIGAQTDAFDGGLVLIVDGVPFDDPDGNGNLVGQSLTVGPITLHGVKVSRTDAALQTSPTLRSLIKFTNTRNAAQTLQVYLDSDLGSDGSGAIRATSTGDLKVTTADRWFVTSDDATTPSDPAVTFVTYGAGAVAARADSPFYGADTEAVLTHWSVRIPGNSTRYLLTYTELHATNESAISAAPKYNKRGLNAALLTNISLSVRTRILNWDLV